MESDVSFVGLLENIGKRYIVGRYDTNMENQDIHIRKMILLFLEAARLGADQGGVLTKDQLLELSIEAALVGYKMSEDATEDGSLDDDIRDILDKGEDYGN